MKHTLLLTLSAVVLLAYSSSCQEYSYTRYDVKDGLAGSNVYCITQDKEGFLWMGTDGGLSRFDGVHFKNFTLEDGLPDIEVLQIFADSKERIWMGPFSKSICYYAAGRIHNQENDRQLAQFHLLGNIHSFAEDKYGNILMAGKRAIHLFTVDGQVREYDSIDGRPIDCGAISAGPDGNFLIECRNDIYHLADGQFSLFMTLPMDHWYSDWPGSLYFALNRRMIMWRKSLFTYSLRSFQTDRTVDFFFEGAANHVSFSLVGDSLAYRNQPDGTTEFNTGTGATRKFNLGVHISRTFRDDEGNTWFTSLGQGIFRLNSDELKNINLSIAPSTQYVPHVIVKIDSDLWVGCNNNGLLRFSLPSMKKKAAFTPDQSQIDDLQFIGKEKNGKMLIGTTTRLYDFFFKKPIDLHKVFTIKEGILKNDSELVTAGAFGIFTIDINDLHVKDTLFRDRATTIRYIDGSLYIGTINGLYVLRKDRSIEYWGDSHPNLRKRISAIQSSPDGVIWIATYGDGISAYKDGKLSAIVTRKQGLSSDICRTIRLDGNILWVGTDKGLNKVDISKPGYLITTYTADDGLGSDIINTIFTDSPMVYVGTPAGLSFFNPTLVDRSARCRLALTGLVSSGKDRLRDTAVLHLPYSQNNIRFEFAGISYKSAGNIQYRYRLLGLDTFWQTTRESFLDYPTLPSGDYALQLYAVNKFGTLSPTKTIHFSVETPFWKTAWFELIVLVSFLALTWLFISLRIKHIRRQQSEEELLVRRMTDLEHTALQAQMNPHFIFNCLNSIQQYIFDQDILAANKYITGFARLIRATLHNSTKDLIPLEDELEYLSTYLSLEKLRFKEKMSYTIEAAPDLSVDGGYWVPPMIIQPYVENCMRHGLRHRKMAGGYIRISVREENGKLAVVVEDNGIGREKAASYKTREHIEYQSKGMSLTADRIRLINSTHEENIEVEIIDLKDAQGVAAGTRVVIKFPKFDLTYQENTI